MILTFEWRTADSGLIITSRVENCGKVVGSPLVHGSGGEHGSESEDFPDEDHDVDYYDNSHVECSDCGFHHDVWSALGGVDDVYA